MFKKQYTLKLTKSEVDVIHYCLHFFDYYMRSYDCGRLRNSIIEQLTKQEFYMETENNE